MPVHHRLRFLTFPMRTSRLCSLWPDMSSLRFRRVPFGRDVAFDPGGATASRVAIPHILPSTVPSVSASATLFLSWLNPPPHPITVYASHPPSPTTAQHSLPGGALLPYRGRSFTGRNASASPDAPATKFDRAYRRRPALIRLFRISAASADWPGAAFLGKSAATPSRRLHRHRYHRASLLRGRAVPGTCLARFRLV